MKKHEMLTEAGRFFEARKRRRKLIKNVFGTGLTFLVVSGLIIAAIGTIHGSIQGWKVPMLRSEISTLNGKLQDQQTQLDILNHRIKALEAANYIRIPIAMFANSTWDYYATNVTIQQSEP